jgi:hypothetical protein
MRVLGADSADPCPSGKTVRDLGARKETLLLRQHGQKAMGARPTRPVSRRDDTRPRSVTAYVERRTAVAARRLLVRRGTTRHPATQSGVRTGGVADEPV